VDHGQVERMNRTIKDATVTPFLYDDHAQLRQHLSSFINDYDFSHRLKTLERPMLCEYIRTHRTSESERFGADLIYPIPGMNI